MLPALSIRNKYWKNGTQFIGRIVNAIIGERNYQFFRLQKRIAYTRIYYLKQSFLNIMSMQTPDVVSSFSVLNKQDMTHGFPSRRPFERSSDFTQYNPNSQSWFQFWSSFISFCVVCYWYWIADHQYFITGVSFEDEDPLRYKDAKQVIHWERTIWNFTFQTHGQHMSAFCRHFKFYTHHPDDPKLNYRPSYNMKNPYAPDRYYKGWGNMRSMRLM